MSVEISATLEATHLPPGSGGAELNSGNAAWHPVIGCDELAPGHMVGVELGDDVRIALYNLDGAFFATANVCTHAFAVLSDGWFEGSTIECPLHGGRFNVTNGKAIAEPAVCDLRTYEVRVVAGIVEVLVDVG